MKLKNIIIIIIALILGGEIGYFASTKNEPAEKNEAEITGKAKLFNSRTLSYDEKLKVNKKGYVVLDIIDNEEDYEEFLGDYDFEYRSSEDIKEYNKKYKYIMLGLYPDYCVSTIEPGKYKIEDDELTLTVKVNGTCGLCSRDKKLLEIAVDKDLEFEDIEIKLLHDDDCPDDVIY